MNKARVRSGRVKQDKQNVSPRLLSFVSWNQTEANNEVPVVLKKALDKIAYSSNWCADGYNATSTDILTNINGRYCTVD